MWKLQAGWLCECCSASPAVSHAELSTCGDGLGDMVRWACSADDLGKFVACANADASQPPVPEPRSAIQDGRQITTMHARSGGLSGTLAGACEPPDALPLCLCSAALTASVCGGAVVRSAERLERRQLCVVKKHPIVAAEADRTAALRSTYCSLTWQHPSCTFAKTRRSAAPHTQPPLRARPRPGRTEDASLRPTVAPPAHPRGTGLGCWQAIAEIVARLTR